MQKSLKTIFATFLIFVCFSCEQHFFYLKKVKTNSSSAQIDNHKKNIHTSSTPDLKAIFNDKDSNKIFSEKYFDKNSDDFLTASIDTLKPYIIKKLPEKVD